jgi:glycosyltransferase involved in cell wall biosynthesis
MAKGTQSKPLVAFIYLGRRGALGHFTMQLAQAAAQLDDYDFEFVISSSNEIADDFEKHGLAVTKIDTFDRATPYNLTTRFFAARRALMEKFSKRPPIAAVTLMPHVWSPLLAPPIRKLGTKYLTIIHDAVPHPGDATAWTTRWLTSDAKQADLVITLSRSVAERVIAKRLAEPGRVFPLFHPDLVYEEKPSSRELPEDRAMRILFFGRIMAYKGLPLLIDAIEILKGRGVPIQLGVAGSGDLGAERERLEKLGADVVNRWIGDDEIGDILGRYDAMACSHIEASQSGVACAAFGSAMPVVAMPVGGIAEQVVEGKTGVLARRITPHAFAEATHRLATVPDLFESVCNYLSETVEDRSTDRFLEEVLTEIESL